MKKLKICVMECDLSSFGGRHITFVDGFFDTFRQMGHEVKVMGYWSDKLLKSKEELIEKSICRLSPDDIVISGSRQNLEKNVISFLKKQDFIFSTIINFRLLHNIGTPVAFWLIAEPHRNVRDMFNLRTRKEETHLPPNVYIWTNSYHQREEAGIPVANVIYPPHDYSLWRKYSKPWHKRKIDILLATGITKGKVGRYVIDKELNYIDEISRKMGLKTVGLFTCRNRRQYEWDIVKNLTFETHINLPRHEVSKYMGNAKIFFHPSPLECAALVHYEALNAGCYPIVREAGACREQLGRVGIIYNKLPNMGFWKWIKEDILPMNYNVRWSQNQGFKFDRVNVMPRIENFLEKYIIQKEGNSDD